MQYETAIIFKDINGNYVHSMVALEGSKIRNDSLQRLKRIFKLNAVAPIYMHTFATRDDGIKAQRAANAILKLFYKAGAGSIDAALPEEAVKEVYELAERGLTDEEMLSVYKKISKMYSGLAKAKSRSDLKGVMYVMQDYDPNGKVYYKIGLTNQGKGACGRLEQLKAEHYLSSQATCIISHDIDSYFTAETAEGYFQAMFFSKKMESPYRPNNSYGTRDLCDECYRLNDADIEAIKKTLANIK